MAVSGDCGSGRRKTGHNAPALAFLLSLFIVPAVTNAGKTIAWPAGIPLWSERHPVTVQRRDGLVLRGHFVQGGLLLGKPDPGARAHFAGRELPLDDRGFFLIGLGRDAPSSLTLELHRDGASQLRHFAVASRDYDIQRIEGVASKHVSPDPQQVARSRREAKRVRTARDRLILRQDYRSGFRWPARGPLTGVFGSQRVYNGQPRRPHFGVDIAGPTGTPVYAPAGGLVTLAEEDLFFSGGTLIIDHGYGLSSSFLHLSTLAVAAGQEVAQGDKIGEMGATGRVTGAHLDWRMNWTLGSHSARTDPQLLVSGSPETP